MTTDKKEKTKKNQIPDSIKSLGILNKGKLFYQLDDTIRNTLLTCKDLMKPGKLKLTIDFHPEVRSEGAQIFLSARIETNLPKPDTVKSLFFMDDDGKLCRNDPNQTEMFDNEDLT